MAKGPMRTSLVRHKRPHGHHRISNPDSLIPLRTSIRAPHSSISHLQRSAGNSAIGQYLQAKLAVGAPGDRYEQEADRVADQVMRVPTATVQRTCSVCASSASPCSKCGTPQPPKIQRTTPISSNTEAASIPSDLSQILGSGQPLDSNTRSFFESRFGHDFSEVRVHSHKGAEQSAMDMNAIAYTFGHHIVFGADRFTPGSYEGRRLIAHELMHVVQQSGGIARVQRAPADDMRWKQDVKAARYRGQLMAKRIRSHEKLSKEARAKINQELAYFEDAAKDAYLREVKPVLAQTVPIEMPETSMVKRPPKPRLSLLQEPSFWEAFLSEPREFSDVEIYKPLKEKQSAEEEEAELATAREADIEKLREKSRDWNAKDRDFAVSLLRPLLQRTTNIDPRAVSD